MQKAENDTDPRPILGSHNHPNLGWVKTEKKFAKCVNYAKLLTPNVYTINIYLTYYRDHSSRWVSMRLVPSWASISKSSSNKSDSGKYDKLRLPQLPMPINVRRCGDENFPRKLETATALQNVKRGDDATET